MNIRVTNQTGPLTYTVCPFLKDLYRVRIANGNTLIFTGPESAEGTVQLYGQFAEGDRTLVFWESRKGSVWHWPDGSRGLCFTCCNSDVFGCPVNIVVRAAVEYDENGSMTKFEPREIWVSEYTGGAVASSTSATRNSGNFKPLFVAGQISGMKQSRQSSAQADLSAMLPMIPVVALDAETAEAMSEKV